MSLILSGTDGLSDVDGSAATPAIRGTDANTGIFFPAADTIAFSEGGVEAMRLDSSGNVGIGTTAPATTLEITASAPEVRISSSNAGQTDGTSVGKLSFYTSDPTTPGGAGVAASIETLSTTSNGSDYALVISKREGSGGGASYINLGASSTGAISFGTNTSGSATERVRIDSSGSLLVGTTSALGKITSSSSFNPDGGTWDTTAAVSTTGSFGGGFAMIEGSAGYGLYCADSGNDFYIRGSNSLSTALTGGVYINDRATSWSAASDERLKTIIEPITDAINKVCQLRTVIGRYNNEAEGKRHPFLIAQDVQAVLPEAVSVADKQSEEQYLGVSYTDTIPLLVAAIQEQQALITQLTARITALEGA